MTDILTKHEIPDTSLAVAGGNPITAMMQSMIEKGVTSSEAAAALEKLADLCLRFDAENAKRAFAKAKCELQDELPPVVAKRIIPQNDGTIRSTFAAYEDIMAVIAPYLTRHGFSVSFTIRTEEVNGKDRICAVCKLTHIMGHTETNEFSVRVSAPPKASDAQADGATRSYARRGALCDCLNIVVDHDTDARLEGDVLKPEQIETLKQRVKATNSDEAKFLRLAGAETWDKIRAGKLAMLDYLLRRKEEANPAKQVEKWIDEGMPTGPVKKKKLKPDPGDQSDAVAPMMPAPEAGTPRTESETE